MKTRLTAFHTKQRKPLARSGFKRPTYEEIVEKAKKPKKKNKPTLKKKKDKLWELCKLITRERFRNIDGTWTCYTSGKILTGENMTDVQTGHGKPNGALPLKYKFDLRNLRIQSLNANKNNGGETDIFIKKLEQEEEGLAFLQEACVLTDEGWKIKREAPMGSLEAWEFVDRKIQEYTQILHNLRTK